MWALENTKLCAVKLSSGNQTVLSKGPCDTEEMRVIVRVGSTGVKDVQLHAVSRLASEDLDLL